MADVAAVKAGALSCGGCDVDARLTAAAFSWSPSAARQTDGKPPGKTHEQGPSGDINLADVIAVTNADDVSFTVTSVVRKPKNILTTQKKSFTCTGAGEWTRCIKANVEKSSPLRPRRLVVIINPQSGKKTSHKVYQEKAAPLFDLAGIETNVILTERQYHATELLQKYDLSTIEGVVSVGGDGTFKECVNGLISRGMKDAGRVTSDAEERPVTPDVRLAALPGGSKNGVSDLLYNTQDVVTCVLHIILGHCEKKLDIASVFSGGQFLGYSFLLLALGSVADAIYDAETNRRFNFLGPARYLIPMFKSMWSPHPIDLELEWKGPPSLKDSVPDAEVSNVENMAAPEAVSPELQKTSATYADIIIFPFKIHDAWERTPGRWYLYTVKPCSRMQHFGFWMKMNPSGTMTLEGKDYIDVVTVDGELTVRITGGGWMREDQKYPLNFDGEVVMLPEPGLRVRIHEEFLNCFSVEHISMSQNQNAESSTAQDA